MYQWPLLPSTFYNKQYDSKQNINMLKSTICIEVCQGPDCTGLGGGAALLEIEELIQEERYQEEHQPINTSSAVNATHQQHQEEEEEVVSAASIVGVAPIIHFQAEAGGCRNFCTVGPNVYISYQNRKSVLESYHHVKDVSSCREVVQNACIDTRMNQKNQTERNEDESFTSSLQNPMHSHSHENMMTRRVDRKRWEALRNISRVISKCKKDVASSSLGNSTRNDSRCQKWKESCERHLDPLTQLELSAAKTNGSKDRAARRSERLSQNISEKLAKYFTEEESSNEGSGSGSDSDSSDHSSSDNNKQG